VDVITNYRITDYQCFNPAIPSFGYMTDDESGSKGAAAAGKKV
jgi:hypothetical protein